MFLDVDGVLHPSRGAEKSFHPECMEALARIIRETGAEVVLSSSWRHWPSGAGRRAVDAALARHGLAGTIGETPCGEEVAARNFKPTAGRAGEIREWLRVNALPSAAGSPSWVVLDDMDMSYDLRGRLVRTDPEDGLTESDADDAIEALLCDGEPPARRSSFSLSTLSSSRSWDSSDSGSEDT